MTWANPSTLQNILDIGVQRCGWVDLGYSGAHAYAQEVPPGLAHDEELRLISTFESMEGHLRPR
jgi:hypothetical protein